MRGQSPFERFCNIRWIFAALVLFAGVAGILAARHSAADRRFLDLSLGIAVTLCALVYLGLDLLVIFAERSIRDGLEPNSKKAMYTTLSHLETAIQRSLQKAPLCRIYKDSLDACWPGLSDDDQAERIAQFAAKNLWVVSFRHLGTLGLVAEFEKASGT